MVIPANYAQVNMIFTGAPVPTGAQWTFGLNNSVTSLTPTGLANIVRTHWTTWLKSFTDSNMSLSTIRVKNGPNDTGPFVNAAGGGAGSAANTCVAPNTAILVRKATLFGGRSGSGRLFFPGVDEAWIDEGGVVGPATVTALQTAFTGFLTAFQTSLVTMVVLHGPSSPLATPTEVTGLVVQSLTATQRRRLRR